MDRRKRETVEKNVRCRGRSSTGRTGKTKMLDFSSCKGVEIKSKKKRAEFRSERKVFNIGPFRSFKSVLGWVS